MQRRWMDIVILVLGLVWIGLSMDRNGTTTAGRIPAPQAGFLAPTWELPAAEGGTVRLADWRGQVVVVNFWASWCGPCRLEMPAFERVYQEYRDQGLVILAVHTTWQDSLQAMQTFVAEHGLTFPVGLDESGKVSRLYRISALPTTFFIGRDGVIQRVVIGGPLAEATLRSEVERLLEGGTP